MDSFQAQFHQSWGHLSDPHVRALAWLLDSPDLLDPAAPQWKGQIATLGGGAGAREREWLSELDRSPGELHAYLDVQPFSRLGRYAEKLMAFYFRHRGNLARHGVQVHEENGNTVGEFDFLLQDGSALIHWEFATKLYLLERSGAGLEADYFVGPNLADTLGKKIRKILDQQLSLALHPAAQRQLPQPVRRAQALIKGWLFYHESESPLACLPGVSKMHCRGFWCSYEELGAASGQHFIILPRLRWLAPAQASWDQALSRQALQETLGVYFGHDKMPVLVAVVRREGEMAVETERGFIVPNDWRIRAGLSSRRVATARS